MTTTSRPVSELARKPEDAACNFIQEDWLSADLPWLNGSQRSIAIEILKNRFSEMAALTRKQTLEECAQVAMYFRDDGVERTGCRTAEVIRICVSGQGADLSLEFTDGTAAAFCFDFGPTCELKLYKSEEDDDCETFKL